MRKDSHLFPVRAPAQVETFWFLKLKLFTRHCRGRRASDYSCCSVDSCTCMSISQLLWVNVSLGLYKALPTHIIPSRKVHCTYTKLVINWFNWIIGHIYNGIKSKSAVIKYILWAGECRKSRDIFVISSWWRIPMSTNKFATRHKHMEFMHVSEE